MENVQELITALKSVQDNPVGFMRPVVNVLAGVIRHRIHVEGLRANGGAIGQYKEDYMTVRKRYNRTSETKMIYSLTRQMEQDFVGIAENDTYGLGFNNAHNFEKASWLEAARPGVYDLSDTEKAIIEDTINDYLDGVLG